jgi:ArsR family transcriptional regulator
MPQTLREEIHELHARLCKAIADPNRILILYSLAECESTVSELAEALDIHQPTVSRHLKVLRERRLVKAARAGQSVIYQLREPRVIEALDLLRSVLANTLQQQADLARVAEQKNPSE